MPNSTRPSPGATSSSHSGQRPPNRFVGTGSSGAGWRAPPHDDAARRRRASQQRDVPTPGGGKRGVACRCPGVAAVPHLAAGAGERGPLLGLWCGWSGVGPTRAPEGAPTRRPLLARRRRPVRPVVQRYRTDPSAGLSCPGVADFSNRRSRPFGSVVVTSPIRSVNEIEFGAHSE